MLKKRILAGAGQHKADLVLKNATIVNVFTEELEQGDVAVFDGTVVGIGVYEGQIEVDCTGKYVVPGLIDGHIHLESSMLQPAEFVRTVLPHGTTALITDPHEIANVCGRDGIDYMYKATRDLPLDVYFGLPSCVPAAPLDESGACLEAEDLWTYYHERRVVGLAEMMNYVGVLAGNEQIIEKLKDARKNGKVIDGHAPGLSGHELCAYISAGIQSDHECATAKEAIEKMRRGQWIMIREGTAAKNVEALMPLFEKPYCERAMLVTDDRHPSDLLEEGHIDAIIRKAIRLGANPCAAVKMGSFNAATYFGLKRMGAVAPDYQADLVVLSDLENFKIEQVYKKGKLVADKGQVIPFAGKHVHHKLAESVQHSFNMKEVLAADFYTKKEESQKATKQRVIEIQAGQILTTEKIYPYMADTDGIAVTEDIVKLAVLERHHLTGHQGLGYIKGYGLKMGAVASSVAHDSHNLIIIGTNEEDMAVAANCVKELQGGWAVVANGEIVGQLSLPIAGLMSELDARTLAERIHFMKERAYELGARKDIDPFMTLAFVSLPVIPELRLTTSGLVHAKTQELVSTIF